MALASTRTHSRILAAVGRAQGWVFACAVLTAGCSGTGSGATPNPVGGVAASQHAETATVVIKLAVPPKVLAKMERARASGAHPESRSTQYVSASTIALNVVVTPHGGSPQPARIFPCSTTSCTASFPASTGAASIALSLTDAANGGGNTLSITGATPVTVMPNVTNTFNLTADPVVASAAVLLGATPASTANTIAGTPTDVPVTVAAYDADHNLIVGPGKYVDANDNPVTLTLSVTNAQAGGSGTVTLTGGTTATAPNTPGLIARYDGKWLQSSAISLSSSSGLVSNLTASTLAITPAVVTEYNIPSAASFPYGITIGPDGAMWFVESTANKIGRVTANGTFVEYAIPTANAQARIITTGPDGALWFTEYYSAKVGRITTSGAVTEYPIPGASGLQGIITGPDGNLWFAEGYTNNIDRITTAGSLTQYAITPYVFPVAMTVGSDGKMWFGNKFGNGIGNITTAGSITEFTTPSAASQFREITSGPDGNLWFTEIDASKIGRITTAGVFTEFPTPTANAGPNGITTGPDGSLWFCEGAANKIGRITTAGAFSEYPIPTAGSNPQYITTGIDGNLWFTEGGSGKIGKIIL